jgi:hypothetical protein
VDADVRHGGGDRSRHGRGRRIAVPTRHVRCCRALRTVSRHLQVEPDDHGCDELSWRPWRASPAGGRSRTMRRGIGDVTSHDPRGGHRVHRLDSCPGQTQWLGDCSQDCCSSSARARPALWAFKYDDDITGMKTVTGEQPDGGSVSTSSIVLILGALRARG